MPLLVDRPALWDVGCGMGYGTLFAGLIRDFAYRKNLFHKRTFSEYLWNLFADDEPFIKGVLCLYNWN